LRRSSVALFVRYAVSPLRRYSFCWYWFVLWSAAATPVVAQQATRAPDECFGFTFGAWDPPLRTVASSANPGGDPAAGDSSGAPRGSAARIATGRLEGDSTLMLFPAWWPTGVTIEWRTARGDTLIGVAHALVADGRTRIPVSAVRGLRVPCAAPRSPPDPA
jgi:hypothetical protein